METDGLLKRITSLLPYVDTCTTCHTSLDTRRCIDQGCQSLICRSIPQVLHQFGPTLMQVRCTTGVACQFAKQDIRISMGRTETTPFARDTDLIGLLIILTGRIVIRHLGRQRIVGYTLQVISPFDITRHLQDGLQRIHHLDSRTEFRTRCRIAIA